MWNGFARVDYLPLLTSTVQGMMDIAVWLCQGELDSKDTKDLDVDAAVASFSGSAIKE